MAMLQVVINPLLRVSGGEEHYSFNSVLAQLIFGAASFLSPLVYSYFVLNLNKNTSFQNSFLTRMKSAIPPRSAVDFPLLAVCPYQFVYGNHYFTFKISEGWIK